MNGLEQAYGDRIEFRGHNIVTEEGEAWATEYALRGHPAFLLLDRQGQEQWRYVGVVPEEVIEEALTDTLSTGE